MQNPQGVVCLIISVLLFSPAILGRAQTSAYKNEAGVFLAQPDGTQIDPQVTTIGGPSSLSQSTSDSTDGVVFSGTGSATADRTDLHASASYSLSYATTCNPCAPTSKEWGAQASAEWFEYGVTAHDVGPDDLIPDIDAYEVTWNLDGTLKGPINDPSVDLFALTSQGGVVKESEAQFFTPPLGPVVFYLQPDNLAGPFDFIFILVADTYSTDPTTSFESVDFSDTATLASVVALDSSGNVLPGVDLELSDGSLLGPDGLVSPETSATPELPSWLLTFSGFASLIAVAGSKKIFCKTSN